MTLRILPVLLVAAVWLWPAAAQAQPALVHWEVANGQVVPQSVCGNYDAGTATYQQCRLVALQIFKSRCQRYTRLASTRPAADAADHRERYCDAFERLRGGEP